MKTKRKSQNKYRMKRGGRAVTRNRTNRKKYSRKRTNRKKYSRKRTNRKRYSRKRTKKRLIRKGGMKKTTQAPPGRPEAPLTTPKRAPPARPGEGPTKPKRAPPAQPQEAARTVSPAVSPVPELSPQEKSQFLAEINRLHEQLIEDGVEPGEMDIDTLISKYGEKQIRGWLGGVSTKPSTDEKQVAYNLLNPPSEEMDRELAAKLEKLRKERAERLAAFLAQRKERSRIMVLDPAAYELMDVGDTGQGPVAEFVEAFLSEGIEELPGDYDKKELLKVFADVTKVYLLFHRVIIPYIYLYPERYGLTPPAGENTQYQVKRSENLGTGKTFPNLSEFMNGVDGVLKVLDRIHEENIFIKDYLPGTRTIIYMLRDEPIYVNIQMNPNDMMRALTILFKIMENLQGLLIFDITNPDERTAAKVFDAQENGRVGNFHLSNILMFLDLHLIYYDEADGMNIEERKRKMRDMAETGDDEKASRYYEKVSSLAKIRSLNVFDNMDELVRLGIIDAGMRDWLKVYLHTNLDNTDEGNRENISEITQRITGEYDAFRENYASILTEKSELLDMIDDHRYYNSTTRRRNSMCSTLDTEDQCITTGDPVCEWRDDNKCHKNKTKLALIEELRDIPEVESNMYKIEELIEDITGITRLDIA